MPKLITSKSKTGRGNHHENPENNVYVLWLFLKVNLPQSLTQQRSLLVQTRLVQQYDKPQTLGGKMQYCTLLIYIVYTTWPTVGKAVC